LKKLLFVCSQNRLRSPSAEQVFSQREDVEAASAGLNHDAEVPLSAEPVGWADLIFVMEKAHRSKLRSKFKQHLRGHQRVICLDIPDDYDYMDPVLVQLLKNKVRRYL
jgi:predicted protein tyrosine phosphatase